MKLRYKIFFIGISVSVVFFCAVYIFLVRQGKILVTRQLENLTHKKVTIGYFDVTAPLNLEIRDLDIEGLMRIDSVFISPSMARLLIGQLAFNEAKITKPRIFVERFPPQPPQEPSTLPQSLATAGNLVTGKSNGITSIPSAMPFNIKWNPPSLVLKHVVIEQGTVDLLDHTAGKTGIRITFRDINFTLTNLYFPARRAVSNFNLSARIPWSEEEIRQGTLESSGWLNLGKRDMLAKLKINGIDGIYLYPYYSNWVDLDKARIEKANLNFSSDIQSTNNNLTAKCHLELTDIIRRPLEEGAPNEKAARIADAVLDIFKALNSGKITLDFTIRTRMDQPEFGFGDIKMAFEEKLASRSENIEVKDVVRLPVRIAEEAFKGVSGISRGVIDGVLAVGGEIKKVITGSPPEEAQKKQ